VLKGGKDADRIPYYSAEESSTEQADATGDGQADFVVNFARAAPWFSEANILI
jgi:hypothetical protein